MTKDQILKSRLYEYMLNKENRLENTVTEYANHVVYRKADAFDHLEMIIATVRLETAKEIFAEQGRILRNWRD